MLIQEGQTDNGVPFVDQDTGSGVERRLLTALPTPRNHVTRALPDWQQATGISPIPRAHWPSLVFHRPHKAVPMLDQDGEGACVGYAATGIGMLIRDRAGMAFRLLSAQFLYSLINGGVDGGANGGDAIQAMMDTGIAPADLVPGRPYRPKGINSQAMSAAPAYKLRPDGAVQITSFDEAITAVAYGWQILFDVQAGARYVTNAEGVVSYLGKWTNHEQQCGEGIARLSNGTFGIWGRNSWGTSWGVDGGIGGGCGIYTEQHIMGSSACWAVKYMANDPHDPNLPPVLAQLRAGTSGLPCIA